MTTIFKINFTPAKLLNITCDQEGDLSGTVTVVMTKGLCYQELQVAKVSFLWSLKRFNATYLKFLFAGYLCPVMFIAFTIQIKKALYFISSTKYQGTVIWEPGKNKLFVPLYYP